MENNIIEISQRERTWGMFCHLSALTMFFIPFGNLIVPLVLWLIKKNESSFINAQGKASLNFQLTFTLISFFICSLIFILASIAVYNSSTAGAYLLLILVCVYTSLFIVNIIFTILVAIEANHGKNYNYPSLLNINFIK